MGMKFFLNLKVIVSSFLKYKINILYLKLLEHFCSNNFNFYSAINDLKSNVYLNYKKNAIFHFINCLKTTKSKDFMTK